MNRSEILEYAASQFGPLSDETGVPLTDTAAGLAYALDATIEDLGDAANDASNGPAARALIEYHSLRKFRLAAAARPDFDATAARRQRSQVYEQIDHLITDAAQRCAATGYPVAAAGQYGPTAIDLAFIEPAPGEELGA